MQTKTRRKIVKFLLAGVVALGAIFMPLKDSASTTLSIPVAYADFCNSKGELVNDSGVVVGTCNPDNGTQYSSESKKDFAEMLEVFLKVIYLLLWPFLALAGLALDNGMVYGSYFQLDAALFTFWNIIKNFANFALGFMFLRGILQYIFSNSGKFKVGSATNPQTLITKLLIAGIGIQASWFVMGALVDVSTIATAGFGALPLKLLSNEAAGEKPLFGMKTNLKISDIGNALTSEESFVILYTYPTDDRYFLPCAIQNQEALEGAEWAKVFGITDTQRKIGTTQITWEQINTDYCMFGNNILSLKDAKGKKLQPGSEELKTILIDSQTHFREDNKCGSVGSVCQTVSNIAQKGRGYQGAFYSLYGSILNLGSIHVAVPKSGTSMTLEAVIKAIIGVAYLVPLLILCVVLIIRIGVLWITIAFSPVLVLGEVFGWKSKAYDKYGLKNALSMIFLPVVVTFAISISIVFLTVLSEGMTKGNSLEEVGMNTYPEGNKTCMDLIITTLCIDNPSQDIGVSGMLDFFPWLILNIFGIGLMWTILMAAMKSTSFTGKVVDSVDKFARNAISTAPIIPIGGSRTSAAGLKNATQQVGSAIKTSADENARTVVSPVLENMIQKNLTGQVGKGKKQLESATTSLGSNAKVSDAKTAVTTLLAPGGALYNNPNASGIINNKNNNLDLSQYGTPGLEFVNKVASTNKLGPYNSIDAAFNDDKFLRFLADKENGLNLSEEQMNSFYSGRDGSNAQKVIAEKIAKVVEAAANTTKITGKRDGKTYKTSDETVYTIIKEGFTKKEKDSKDTIKLTTEKDWDDLLSKIDKDTMKKMKDDSKETLETKFETWLTGKKPEATNNTNTSTNNTQQNNNQNKTNTSTQNQQPPTSSGTTTP